MSDECKECKQTDKCVRCKYYDYAVSARIKFVKAKCIKCRTKLKSYEKHICDKCYVRIRKVVESIKHTHGPAPQAFERDDDAFVIEAIKSDQNRCDCQCQCDCSNFDCGNIDFSSGDGGGGDGGD